MCVRLVNIKTTTAHNNPFGEILTGVGIPPPPPSSSSPCATTATTVLGGGDGWWWWVKWVVDKDEFG